MSVDFIPPVEEINGSDILLGVELEGGTFQALAGQRNLSRSETTGTIDTSSKLDDSERFIAGRHSSTLSFDGLWSPNTDSFQRLVDARRNREIIVCRIFLDGDAYEECDGFITSLDTSWPDNDAATYSAQFQVSGAWRKVEAA
jgi:predicted secreted protein